MAESQQKNASFRQPHLFMPNGRRPIRDLQSKNRVIRQLDAEQANCRFRRNSRLSPILTRRNDFFSFKITYGDRMHPGKLRDFDNEPSP